MVLVHRARLGGGRSGQGSGRRDDAIAERGASSDQFTERLGSKKRVAETEKLMLELGGQSCDVSEAVWRKRTPMAQR